MFTSMIVGHLQVSVTDPDVDVQRSALDSLAQLAFHIWNYDVVADVILPIPLSQPKQQQPSKNGVPTTTSSSQGSSHHYIP